MILFSKEEGLIKATGIRKLDGARDANYKLPHIAVGVFSEYLLDDIVEKFECIKVGFISGANCSRPVYIMKYEDIKITLFMAGVSGPWISTDIEELSANGVDTFIIFGNCGVLDKKIEDCSIIIPNKAFRDEETSYHYVPDSESIEMNKEYKNIFKQVLNENGYKYEEGATWTTDGFYRETKDKIESPIKIWTVKSVVKKLIKNKRSSRKKILNYADSRQWIIIYENAVIIYFKV